jgi:hypothetical protein
MVIQQLKAGQYAQTHFSVPVPFHCQYMVPFSPVLLLLER